MPSLWLKVLRNALHSIPVMWISSDSIKIICFIFQTSPSYAPGLLWYCMILFIAKMLQYNPASISSSFTAQTGSAHLFLEKLYVTTSLLLEKIHWWILLGSSEVCISLFFGLGDESELIGGKVWICSGVIEPLWKVQCLNAIRQLYLRGPDAL